ncbi:MAG: transglutaminase family protein [Candidatus Magasanikbacteria bacterium]|nr:transglutaminase family protein [Candidatus Magasanikbacteria bacterium]
MFYRRFQKILISIVALQMIIMPVVPALADEITSTGTSTPPALAPAEPPKKDDSPFSARQLMREYQSFISAEKNKNNSAAKVALAGKLDALMESESKSLSALGVDAERQARYFGQLQTMAEILDPARQSFVDKKVGDLKAWLGLKKPDQSTDEANRPDIVIPAKPASFRFNNAPIELNKIKLGEYPSMAKRLSLRARVRDIFSIDQALAGPLTLPVLADVEPDGAQVVSAAQFTDLAQSLHNNPLEIYNYVRQTISYEAYYGAKKGALGCFREKFCNDADASSLLIALLRAAGIPARYVKGVAVLPVETARQLVGVDETKTAYAALYANRVPVFLVSGNNVGPNYDQADFSQEKYFGVEWVSVEAFYDYDERGGNINNTLNLSTATTTESLQAILQQASPEKQWIPLDPMVQPSVRTVNEIVADTAQFNSQTFWNDYLKYQGPLSPLNKYAADLKNQTNKDIFSDQFQSSAAPQFSAARLLPATLPYNFTSGLKDGDLPIAKEYWSILPNDRQEKVIITLKRAGNNEAVITHTFLASEANNQPIDLSYAGATPDDQAVIDGYGGLAYTPAALVDILPSFTLANTTVPGNIKMAIGDSLIMQFEYQSNGQTIETNQKFSVAGNAEGIYMAFSQIVPDPSLVNNSQILFAGNAAIARAYLNRLAADNAVLAKSLDYQLNTEFARAVVTQNRVLSKVNDIPTTFDFKGLTIDAGAVINDYSRRGNYKNHRLDFRLLSGQNASYYEGQLFTDLAGLNGISTIKGLQYAYANPNDYTVHTITKANEADIDALQLSDNTKQNLHSEVAKGNTITTPNKPIAKGAFTGIVYTSIAPNGTGLYAIGEQVANGGWTVNPVVLAQLQSDVDNSVLESFQVDDGNNTFVYRDKLSGSIDCRINSNTFGRILANKDKAGQPIPAGEAEWKTRYGWPCVDDNENGPYKFGDYEHDFLVATDGAKFTSPGRYEYWVNDTAVENLFKTKFDFNNGNYSLRNVRTYWGTYIYKENWETHNLRELGVYNPEHRKVYEMPIFRNGEKYLSADKIEGKFVPELIGYPMSENKTAALSPNGTDGYYQQFTNGTMYTRPSLSTFWKSLVVYGKWNDIHNQQGGTGGIGFPDSDTFFDQPYNAIIQKFEKKICYDKNGIICENRIWKADFQRGLDSFYDSFQLMSVAYTIYKNNVMQESYAQFLVAVDLANDTREERKNLCYLYNAEYSQPLFLYPALYADAQCVFPKSLAYYQSKKADAQNKINDLGQKTTASVQQAEQLHLSLVSQVENGVQTPFEWLGFMVVDLGTVVVGPASKLGVNAAKQVALKMTARYGAEIMSARINRALLMKATKKAAERELAQQGAAATESALEVRLERAVLGELKGAGLAYVERRGIKVPMDLAKQLPGKWYKSTSSDVVDSFAKHWQKHGVLEMEKKKLPLKTIQEYFDDSKNFYNQYKGLKTSVTLDDLTEGILIRQPGQPGGYFTGPGHPMGEGLAVTFWYF